MAARRPFLSATCWRFALIQNGLVSCETVDKPQKNVCECASVCVCNVTRVHLPSTGSKAVLSVGCSGRVTPMTADRAQERNDQPQISLRRTHKAATGKTQNRGQLSTLVRPRSRLTASHSWWQEFGVTRRVEQQQQRRIARIHPPSPITFVSLLSTVTCAVGILHRSSLKRLGLQNSTPPSTLTQAEVDCRAWIPLGRGIGES